MRFEQGAHERDVDHRCFVDDKKIAVEWVAVIAIEAASLDFKEAMNGLRGQAGTFGETTRGAAGWGAEKGANFFGRENGEDGIDERGFADAGPTGDDEDAALQRLFERGALRRGELFAGAFLDPFDRSGNVDGRVVWFFIGEFEDAFGDFDLGVLQARQKKQFFAFDGFGRGVLLLN